MQAMGEESSIRDGMRATYNDTGITSKDILNKHLLSTHMNPTSYGSLVSQTFAPN